VKCYCSGSLVRGGRNDRLHRDSRDKKTTEVVQCPDRRPPRRVNHCHSDQQSNGGAGYAVTILSDSSKETIVLAGYQCAG
jgi:hypothetical protein